MHMTEIPNSDLTDGYRELSSNAFKVLTYFYSKGDGWVFDNKFIAHALDLKTRTISDLIRELEIKGYLLQQKGNINVYIVGKLRVHEYS